MNKIIRGLGATMAIVSILGVSGIGTAAADSMHPYMVHRHFVRRPIVVTNITNRNDVTISNRVFQFAQSGNATVSGNKFGGNATTGSASNSSSISTTVIITNN